METAEKGTKKYREKGMGTISQSKDGTWRARIIIEGKAKYFQGKSKQVVKKKLEDYKKAVIKGEADFKCMKVSEMIDEFIEIYKKPELKGTSYDKLCQTYRLYINDELGTYQISNLSAGTIQKHINELSKKYAYNSVKKVYELLNASFRKAVLLGYLAKNPVEAVVMPRKSNFSVKEKEIIPMTDEEVKALENMVDIKYMTGKPQYKYAPAYVFLAHTGLRYGELLALTWADVDWEKRVITINKNIERIYNHDRKENDKKMLLEVTSPKTKKSNRKVPLNDTALDMLNRLKDYQEQYIDNNSNNLVVCTGNGEYVGHGTFYRILNRQLDIAGIENRGLHALRHTFASRALAKGIDVHVVSSILGHSTVSITMNIYAHIMPDQLDKAVNMLNLL